MWNPESLALESEIQLKEFGIPLATGIQNASSADKGWNLVSGIRNPESGIRNVEPRIRDCLGFSYMGRDDLPNIGGVMRILGLDCHDC